MGLRYDDLPIVQGDPEVPACADCEVPRIASHYKLNALRPRYSLQPGLGIKLEKSLLSVIMGKSTISPVSLLSII